MSGFGRVSGLGMPVKSRRSAWSFQLTIIPWFSPLAAGLLCSLSGSEQIRIVSVRNSENRVRCAVFVIGSAAEYPPLNTVAAGHVATAISVCRQVVAG